MIDIKHLGDITKISGYTAPIVDCIVGGSPCQDLSIAGKRAGLDGERSGLFMEQVRIVKEMRDRDERDNGRTGVDVRPRYMVWENVPGAFSSNKGEDFRIVLEEIAKVKDKDAVIPQPDKWQTSGCILGDGWSIAWRVLDAQFWGVPQRRRRIALVADFGGHSASEILFVTEGVCGHPQPSESKRKATPSDATRGSGADDIYCIDGDKLNKKERSGGSGIGYREGNQYTLTAKDVHGVAYDSVAYTMKIRSGCDVDANGKPAGKGALIQTEKSGTLSCVQDQYLFQPVYSVENHPADSLVDIDGTGKVQTLTSRMGTGGGNVPMVMEPTVFSKSKRAQTPTDYETRQESDTANTLNTFDQGDVRTNECVIALDRASYNQGKNAQFDIGISESGTAQSLVAKGPGAVCYTVDQGGGKSACNVTEEKSPTLTCTHGGEPAVCTKGETFVIEGNGSRPSHLGNGYKKSDVMYALNTVDRHAVFAMTTGSFTQVEEEKSPTLMARDFKDPNAVCYGIGRDAFNQGKNAQFTPSVREESQPTLVAKGPGAVAHPYGFDPSASRDLGQYFLEDCGNTLVNGTCPGHHNGVMESSYTVRRLTPTECARLQGFPDFWCKSLETPNPTEEEIAFWVDVWATYAKIVGTCKPKTEKQVKRWLENPHCDSSEYKLWGNGVALPCVFFVLAGIVYCTHKTD